MNHIARMTAERNAAQAAMVDARLELRSIMLYLASDKFTGPGNDYVHVRTDIMPRLERLRSLLDCGPEPEPPAVMPRRSVGIGYESTLPETAAALRRMASKLR